MWTERVLIELEPGVWFFVMQRGSGICCNVDSATMFEQYQAERIMTDYFKQKHPKSRIVTVKCEVLL